MCRPAPRPVVRQIVLGVSGTATSTVAVARQSMTPGLPPSICSTQRIHDGRLTHHDLSAALIRRGPRDERERGANEGEDGLVADIDRPCARHGTSIGIASHVVADRPAGPDQAQVRRPDRRDRLSNCGRADEAEGKRRRRAHQRREAVKASVVGQTSGTVHQQPRQGALAPCERSRSLTLGGPLPFLE